MASEDRNDTRVEVRATPLAPAVLDFIDPVEAGAFLHGDHDQLTAMAEGVVKAIREGDRDDVAAVITALQRRVLAHLEAEERDLLPPYAKAHPTEAAHLHREHADLREVLAQLDVTTDLHLVRAEAVKALLSQLRAHAVRENASLYRWARCAHAL